MNIEEIKQSITFDIENELNNLLEQMIKTNKLSIEYKLQTNKKDILDKELEKINTLNENNIETFINNTTTFDEEIIIVREHFNNYKKRIKELKNDVLSHYKIPDTILGSKENKLETLKITNETDLDNAINILEEKTSEFEKHVSSYYEKIKYFSYIDYVLFKTNLENNRINLKIDLEKFKNLGVDNLIDRLTDMYEELNLLNNSKLKTKIKEDKIKLLEIRIKKYLSYLIRNVEYYVLRSFETENSYLDLNVENNENFDKYYKEITEKIKEKYTSYKKTLKMLMLFKNNYIKGIKLSYENNLKKANIIPSNLKKYTSDDFMNMTSEELDDKIISSNIKRKIIKKENIRKK